MSLCGRSRFGLSIPDSPRDGLAFDGFTVRFPAETPQQACLFIDPSRPKKELDAAISAALHMVLRREARLDLHAAAVLPPAVGAGAVLVVGAKGVGKSSLTLALATAGWGFLSDDLVLAWRDESQTRLGCLRPSLYLTPDAVDRLKASRPPGREVPRMGKRMFEPEEIFPGQHLVETTAAAATFDKRRKCTPGLLEVIGPPSSTICAAAAIAKLLEGALQSAESDGTYTRKSCRREGPC